MRLILDMPPISFNGFPHQGVPRISPSAAAASKPTPGPRAHLAQTPKVWAKRNQLWILTIGQLAVFGIRAFACPQSVRFSESPLSSCRFHLCQWQDCRTHRVLWHTSQAENIRLCRPLDAVL